MQPCSLKNLNSKQSRGRLQKLMTALGFSFQQPQLLLQALVHSSYAHENPKLRIAHNERLEFLGDAVLELIVSHWLYRSTPELSEGAMTRARSSAVCERSLSLVARQIGLHEYLLLGCGEQTEEAKVRPSILADAYEAVVGAVYLDGGMEAARQFVENTLGETLLQAEQGLLYADYKKKLQEELQKEGPRNIVYELEEETGPPHARQFRVSVSVDGVRLGSGTGKTKKQAEQDAAQAALAKQRS